MRKISIGNYKVFFSPYYYSLFDYRILIFKFYLPTLLTDDCERLCAEVDQLLDRSEQAEDLITALSLCNAAVNKARAAMDAPYSNPQTASFATMKHNACVLRARTLHRKLEEPLHNNLKCKFCLL